MIRKKYFFLAGLIAVVGIASMSSGCGMLFYPFLPKASSTTSTIAPGPAGSFTISGTISSGALSPTTMEVGVALFKNKSDLQTKSAPPITSESGSFVSSSFNYSLPTNEGGTYYVVAYYPSQSGEPTWVGGPGVNSSYNLTQFMASLLGVDLTLASPNPTINITLYPFLGP